MGKPMRFFMASSKVRPLLAQWLADLRNALSTPTMQHGRTPAAALRSLLFLSPRSSAALLWRNRFAVASKTSLLDGISIFVGVMISRYVIRMSRCHGDSMAPSVLDGSLILSIDPSLYVLLMRTMRAISSCCPTRSSSIAPVSPGNHKNDPNLSFSNSSCCGTREALLVGKIVTVKIDGDLWRAGGPGCAKSTLLCKRVVRLQKCEEEDDGHSVRQCDSRVISNLVGELIQFPSAGDARADSSEDGQQQQQQQLWVEGDNSENSWDSNFFGPVDFCHVTGVVYAVVWPFRQARFLQ